MLGSGGMPKPSKPIRRGPGRPPAGRVKVLVSLEPAQLLALRREALARSNDGSRVDVSAVIREALAAWLAKRGR